jgi:hypothetical protein
MEYSAVVGSLTRKGNLSVERASQQFYPSALREVLPLFSQVF